MRKKAKKTKVAGRTAERIRDTGRTLPKVGASELSSAIGAKPVGDVKKTELPLPPVEKKKELCDKCGEKYKEELLECPSCGTLCCTDRCIAGRNVSCFPCEEGAAESAEDEL